MNAAFHPAEHLDRGRSKDIALEAALPLSALSEWRLSTDITLYPESSSDGSFEGKGMFYLMYSSNLAAQMPLRCLEQGQVLLTGHDVPFLNVNWKNTKTKQKTNKKENKNKTKKTAKKPQKHPDVVELLWWGSCCSSVLRLFIRLPVVFHRIMWLTVQTFYKVLGLSRL